jgi:hypothetical protein
MVFFGVPHRGSQLSNWGTVVANIVSVFKSVSTTNLEVLRKDSNELLDISQHFEPSVGENLRIMSFYETLKTKTWAFRSILVRKVSPLAKKCLLTK